MARSVTRQPNPTKREPSLSLHHTMGISAAGGMTPYSNPLPWNRGLAPPARAPLDAQPAYGSPPPMTASP
ncbi:MAG: hypothetical protein OXE74_09165 [Cyanobacteria bacterium MAG CAR2_bin_4]|nr:hypothetical protein [Cyanobacteria bacterium MAG CAR2_bin_4]